MPRREDGYFSSKKDNTRLFWQGSWPDAAPKAAIAIVHGYGDHSERYRYAIDAFVAQGFEVMAFDYRSHGRADGKRGDVAEWSSYLDDLDAFWAKFNEMVKSPKRFMLAHSHGGLMATHWVQQPRAGLSGLILSSPYYRLAFEPPAVKLIAAKVMRRLMPSLVLGTGLKGEDLSRDTAWQASSMADPLYGKVISSRTFFGQLDAQARLAGTGKDVTLPLLMLGGDADPIASVPAAKAFFDTIGSTHKTWKSWPGMRHELLMEIGKEDVVSTIAGWISAQC